MYYGVYNDKRSYIGQARLDGTQIRKFKSGGSKEVIPSLLSIDYANDRLYWVDGVDVTTIESAFTNGRSALQTNYTSVILYEYVYYYDTLVLVCIILGALCVL